MTSNNITIGTVSKYNGKIEETNTLYKHLTAHSLWLVQAIDRL
jgi:hypothetical protein